MPRFIDKEEQEQTPQKGEMLRQAGVVVCLVIGVLLKKAGIDIGAMVFFAAAFVCALAWIRYVRKQDQQKKND